MKLIRKNNKKGFTLVELIVVIAILAILALILIPAISGYTRKANKSAIEASARSLYSQSALIVAEGDVATLQSKLTPGDKFEVEVDEGATETAYSFTVYFKDKKGANDLRVKVDQNGNLTTTPTE